MVLGLMQDWEITDNGSGETEVNGTECVDKTEVDVMNQWKDREELKPGEV